MLRAFFTLGAVNTVTGAQPNNPGLLGPLNQPIGPLPAMQMPGEIAKTIPVMANFNWILQVLQTATFATVEDDSAILLASRRLVAGTNVTFVDSYPDTGPGNHATLTINATGGGGGKEIFFDVDPPPAGTETDWLAWWNTEEGALKIWYTIADGDPDSDQWVDAMPARTGEPGASGAVSPLTTKGDVWGFSTVDARIPVGADGEVLTADSGAALGVSWQAAGSVSPLTTKGDLYGFSTLDARVPVGTDGFLLTADSGAALGVSWQAAPATGAPVNAQYVVLALNATLTNERVLTGTAADISITDNGANSTVVLDLINTAVTPGTYGGTTNFVGSFTVDAKGRITAASNIAVVGTIETLDEGLLVDVDAIALNFVGAGVTATDAGSGVTTVTVPLKAPLGASYITLGTDADLTNERVLTPGTNVTFADGGAGSTLTINAAGAASPLTTKGDLFGFSTVDARVAVGSNGKVLTADSAAGVGVSWQTPTTGTVTSVALTMPTGWTVGGSPITSSGTLAITGGPNASFLTLATSTDLANERVFTAGTGISVSDGGAGGLFTVNSTITQAGNSKSQEFTSSGTFTPGTGVSAVKVTYIGAGGGGSSRTLALGGGGGGAGELVENQMVPCTPGVGITVTIGAKGTGAAGAGAGNNGGDTSFGSTFVAKGGSGGASGGSGGAGGGARGGAGGGVAAAGGAGTAGTGITPTCFGGGGGGGGPTANTGAGGAGAPSAGYAGAAAGSSVSTQGGGGGGASSRWGLGGAAGSGGSNGSSAASTSYGAGGGGSGGKTGTSGNGGDGCDGYVLVTWEG